MIEYARIFENAENKMRAIKILEEALIYALKFEGEGSIIHK